MPSIYPNFSTLSQPGKIMRYSLLGLALLSTVALAEPTKDALSQARFEERFHAADKNKDGKLSRAEANAEFPRAPEFFDQIDSNKDNAVTLAEVKRAVDRYVKATLASSKPGSKYVQPQDLKGEPTPAASPATPARGGGRPAAPGSRLRGAPAATGRPGAPAAPPQPPP
eukprot:gene10872-13806_t